MTSQKKIYFASDFHLGAPDRKSSLQREKIVVKWLQSIEDDVEELYLMGDLFDFWFEFGKVVPKGFVRLLGQLALMADKGIKLHIFTGNHDLWMNSYFQEELGATIYKEPVTRTINDKVFYLAHGDGLGPSDQGYKFIKKVFTNKVCQWLFARLHPNFGISLADFFSKRSRHANELKGADKKFRHEKEWLIAHSRDVLQKQKIDYFIFGHRHYPKRYPLNDESIYFNLGDWINHFSYAVFDGKEVELRYFDSKD